MPGYKTHDNITMYVVIPIFGISAWLYGLDIGLIVSVSFVFSGLMFNGDLDTNSTIYKRWGPLRIVWWPYNKIIPHRSILSHGPLIGTAIRVAWISLFLLPFIDFEEIYWDYVLVCLIGLELGSQSHTLADHF